MKERIFVTGLVALLAIGALFATGSMDAIFIAISLGFFLLCIAYAEWCERL